MSNDKPRLRWFHAIAPGILVAATGVGAGDLMTASLGGSAIGLAILWAAVAGALLKWFLTEGIARWQMATGTTLLEGWVTRLGAWMQWVFLGYLLVWCFFTGGALVSACGVAGTGLFPLSEDPQTSKILWGVLHSALGLALVLIGGFKLFERLMAACIGVMFVAVLVTAFACKPDWAAAASGLVIPTIPEGGTGWVLGLMGGVGGTLTLLSYGYWIREEGRSGESGMRACRLDLLVGYSMTAIFGLAMVLIGSTVEISGGGARVAPVLADQLGGVLGPAGRLLFLVGFWGAVFSSLLGVWQSIPYLFADFMALRRGDDQATRDATDFAGTFGYRACLIGLAVFSLPVLFLSVKQAQLAYAVLGSLFMPLLALTLLILNNRSDWVGERFRNGWAANAVLGFTLLFFGWIAARTAVDKLGVLLGG
jgi:Mn2+/Fe2+ NRAMP family transporter